MLALCNLDLLPRLDGTIGTWILNSLLLFLGGRVTTPKLRWIKLSQRSVPGLMMAWIS